MPPTGRSIIDANIMISEEWQCYEVEGFHISLFIRKL
jgi:hypothetical protein